MTRAVQTLSVLLLVSSVCYGVPSSQKGTQSRMDITDNRSALPFPFPWTRSPERDCPD